jgi:L-ascorbate metabolism protein UlaG (beta-lactamase superfamily)
VDLLTQYADYSRLPKADLVLITHEHVAGDTENTPEVKALKDIDIAFLPMNLPFTMTPAMVADAARAFKPKVLYPYHFGETDTSKLADLLKDTPEVEVRIRKMK